MTDRDFTLYTVLAAASFVLLAISRVGSPINWIDLAP
jgi:hypothetical protein